MANEKFLNQTGLTYYHDRAKTVFADKATLEALDTKVDGIIAEGGEPNVIEKIKVNGTEQTITNKEVNLPTAVDYNYDTSLLKVETGGSSGSKLEIKQNASIKGYDFTKTNLDSGYSDTITLVSTEYVDANGGKIDKIKVNGVEQTITNKEVDLAVPNVTAGDKSITVNVPDNSKGFYLEQKSGGVEFGGTHADGDFGTVILTDKAYVDRTFRTQQQVQDAIDTALAGVTSIDYQKVDTLPASGEKGIIYLVSNSGTGDSIYDEYIWIQVPPGNGTDESHFEKIGTTEIDLSDYYNTTNLQAITTAEIDELFA